MFLINTYNIMKSKLILIFIAGLFVLASCSGDDGDSGTNAVLTAQEFVDVGWLKFEEQSYEDALADFKAAIQKDASLTDAHTGAGWSSGRLPGNLSVARSYLIDAATLDTAAHDARGGLIFIEFQNNELQSALSRADSLLSRLPGWRFLHDPTVDFRDVKLLTAVCYYNLGNYATSLMIIKKNQFLNPDFDADITTEEGQRELLEEIERLGEIHG